jgi:hypothetical protein
MFGVVVAGCSGSPPWSDDGAGDAGEVSLESIAKTASSAVGSPPDAKPTSARTTGNNAKQNQLKACRGKPFDLMERVQVRKSKRNFPLMRPW